MRRAGIALLLVASACGQRLVGGDYLGDTAVVLNAVMQDDVGAPPRVAAGVAWLGYDASTFAMDLETSYVPLTTTFAPELKLEVMGAPPATGNLLATDGTLIVADVRIGRVIVFEDVDGDNHFAIDAQGNLAPPDRLLAIAPRQGLLFVQAPPANARQLDADPNGLLSNWELADFGYHVLQLDGTPDAPEARMHVVDTTASIVFVRAPAQVTW